MRPLNSTTLIPVAASMLALSACDSSSTPSDPLISQAIDGYLVGSTVLCDGEASAPTAAAGSLQCPADTRIVEVAGGHDVGTDTIATQVGAGATPFNGTISALASSPVVTPLTTLTIDAAKATLGDDFENVELSELASEVNTSTDAIAMALGVSPRVFSANPAQDIDASKINANIHLLADAFSTSEDNYRAVSSAISQFLLAVPIGEVIDFDADTVGITSAINRTLSTTAPELSLNPAELSSLAATIEQASRSIDNARSPGEVFIETAKATVNFAVATLEKNSDAVTLSNEGNGDTTVSINEFEDDSLTNGLFNTVVFSGITEVSFDNSVLTINRDIADTSVTVTFEILSVNDDDERSLVFQSEDVIVNANENQSNSLVITLDDNSTFDVRGVDGNGTATLATIENDDSITLSSDADSFTINTDSIQDRLDEEGFDYILNESGDYRITMVINGISINQQDGIDAATQADTFTITSGDVMNDGIQATGPGFQGFLSVELD